MPAEDGSADMIRRIARVLVITFVVAYLVVRYTIRRYARKELSWPRQPGM